MKMNNKWLSYGVMSAFFWMTACGSLSVGGTQAASPTASEQAAPNAALSSVNSSVVSALSNLGVQANLGARGGSGLVKFQETSEESSSEENSATDCSAENPCVDTCSGGGTITTVIAETEENVFSMTLTYAGCIEEQCGEAVAMDGVVTGKVIYDGSATATLTTGGTCGNGGLMATVNGVETDLFFNLEVVVNDISLPEEEVVVTVNGEFCTGDESQTIDSFDDFETDACMEAEASDEAEDTSEESEEAEDDTSSDAITQDTNGLCYNTSCIDDLNDPTLNAVPCMGLEEAPRLACQASCQVDCPQS